MADTVKKYMEINKGLKEFFNASPQVIGAFKALRGEACNDKGVLDFKTKELIAVAVSVARKCEPCVLSHLDVAIQVGVTREELVESLNIAILLCGGPGYAYAASALTAYDEMVAAKA